MTSRSRQAKSRGDRAEQAAEQYLCERGLQPVAKNYRCKQGEIDLIMRDNQVLVFVEVRYRSNANFGSPLETVTATKQRKVIIAAQHYLSENKFSEETPIRFDVIGICAGEYQWIQSAFLAS